MNPESIHVRHNTDERRFEAEIEGELALTEYHRNNELMVFTRTFVPEDLRHEGVAARIVKVALDYARERGYRVEPQCSYVADWIERHPDYQELVD